MTLRLGLSAPRGDLAVYLAVRLCRIIEWT